MLIVMLNSHDFKGKENCALSIEKSEVAQFFVSICNCSKYVEKVCNILGTEMFIINFYHLY